MACSERCKEGKEIKQVWYGMKHFELQEQKRKDLGNNRKKITWIHESLNGLNKMKAMKPNKDFKWNTWSLNFNIFLDPYVPHHCFTSNSSTANVSN